MPRCNNKAERKCEIKHGQNLSGAPLCRRKPRLSKGKFRAFRPENTRPALFAVQK
jgi:hypothetical protein